MINFNYDTQRNILLEFIKLSEIFSNNNSGLVVDYENHCIKWLDRYNNTTGQPSKCI